MIYLKTEKCVLCGRKAVTWFGHVERGNQKIIAGWCREHKVDHDVISRGYCGSYLPEKHGRCISYRV